ncbi:MAG: hypothetical protein K6T99_12825 [Armatimonadetes bacterium]|nr:hypothetical protein [Armatimonadota bacterium]
MKKLPMYMVTLVLLCFGLLIGFAPINAEPWPDYISHPDTVDYISVLYSNINNLWCYYLTIDSNAFDPRFGELIGVKGLAVYLNAGNLVEGIPDDWVGYETSYTRTGWDYNGGWEPNKGAFGYITGSPSYYVLPGEINALIGAALFPIGFTPNAETQGFLLHVAYQDNDMVNTFWVRPEGGGIAVPEPAGVLALVGIGVPALWGFIYRRRSL